MRTLTKKTNRKIIMVYYVLALVFAAIGIYNNDSRYYVIAVVILALALFRKYWLMRKLKE